MSATLTTKKAAEKLGVTPARVRQLVLSGQLPAEKFGRDLVINEADLSRIADRPIGRPRKPESASTNGKPPLTSPDGKVNVKKSDGAKKTVKKASKK